MTLQRLTERQNGQQSNDELVWFYGFQRSPRFERLFHRLQGLERWCELAIAPLNDEIDTDDQDLLQQQQNETMDDPGYDRLHQRCLRVRHEMNQALPPIQTTIWEPFLQVSESTIPEAGMGLFYRPSETDNANDSKNILPKNMVICYYTGHLHNYRSARALVSDRSYLMTIQGNVLVDPGPCREILARYINDPLVSDDDDDDDDSSMVVNCRFQPQDDYRSAVITRRTILPGEELFCSYGDGYWSQQSVMGKSLLSLRG